MAEKRRNHAAIRRQIERFLRYRRRIARGYGKRS